MVLETRILAHTPFPPLETVFSSKGKIKILKALMFNGELNISAIVRRSRLNHTTVSQHLAYFKKVGIVQEKAFGRIKVYYLLDNDKVQAIRDLIEFWHAREEGE